MKKNQQNTLELYKAFMAQPKWSLGPLTGDEKKAVLEFLNESVDQESAVLNMLTVDVQAAQKKFDLLDPRREKALKEATQRAHRVSGLVRLIHMLEKIPMTDLPMYCRDN